MDYMLGFSENIATADTSTCNNDNFGDPVPGSAKACWCQTWAVSGNTATTATAQIHSRQDMPALAALAQMTCWICSSNWWLNLPFKWGALWSKTQRNPCLSTHLLGSLGTQPISYKVATTAPITPLTLHHLEGTERVSTRPLHTWAMAIWSLCCSPQTSSQVDFVLNFPWYQFVKDFRL